MASIWSSFWRREPKEAKGLSISLEPGGFVTELRDYRRPRYPSADADALHEALTHNELVFACVGIKATASQDPRLVVQKATTKGEYQEVPGHPMRQLLMRPNPMMTEADLMRAAIVSWDVSNPRRFYAEKEVTNGLLTAIWPLNPAKMRAIPSRTPPYGTIGYEWNDGLARREYSLDELLIRSAPSWYDPPPLVAALGATESDTAQTDVIRAFFENGGIPPGLLKYKNMKLRKDQRDEIREQWRSTYGNMFGRQHDIGVLDGEVDFQEIGGQLDKLHSPTLRSVAEARICMTFGVPPLIVYAYVGLLRATYANLRDAWSGFWDATMSPAFKEWRMFFLWNLLTEYEEERDIKAERVRLHYDMSQVAALQDDVDGIHKRARESFQSGGITRAEYRTAIGQQPGPNDDFYLLPASMQVVPATEMPAQPVVSAPPKQHQNGREKVADAAI